MVSYTLSRQADSDVETIARESVKRWGRALAEEYILGLHDAFERLAEFHHIGRDTSHIRAGYLQLETARHSIFYRKAGSGVLIVRVLHQAMLPENYL